MTTPAQARKRDLRRQLRAVLTALDPELRRAASSAACQLLARQAAWAQARAVLCYSPLPEELDIREAARAALTGGKVVALLSFDPSQGVYGARRIVDWQRDLAPGAFGILEPRAECPSLDMNRLDFVLVPGLGFTQDGRRLGRGRGYYDRVLARVGGFKCGVAFDQQVVGEIPAEPHDVRLDCILTPTRWCCVTQAAALN